MSSGRRRLIGAQRDHAERYLIITIVAFAVTVAGTRWYLDLAGYPTIGGGELHVAHALWGGLALVLAVLLPLLWVGRRSLLLSALLAGIGVGLFIDEVGKFLTTSTDYFFAPAAPIIYGSLMLLVLLFLLVRRRRVDRLEASHAALEALRDGIDGRLTPQDRQRVIGLLRDRSDHDLDEVERGMLDALTSSDMDQRLATAGPIARGDARRWLERVLPTRAERWLVLAGLVLTALQAVMAVIVLLAWDQVIVGGLTLGSDATSPIEYPSDPVWALLMLAIAVLVGIGSAAALSLVRRGREQRAMDVALAAVMIGMVAGDLVAFYAFQLGALASTLMDLLLVALIVDYRIRLGRDRASVEVPLTTRPGPP